MPGPAQNAPPVEPSAPSLDRPTHRFPEGSWTPEEEELLAKGGIDPVDVNAALRWMLGEGPDPWRESSD